MENEEKIIFLQTVVTFTRKVCKIPTGMCKIEQNVRNHSEKNEWKIGGGGANNLSETAVTFCKIVKTN